MQVKFINEKKNKNTYHIVIRKERVHPLSNLDLIGKISKIKDNYGLVKLNDYKENQIINKLNLLKKIA